LITFIDSNIFIYAIDQSEPIKRHKAIKRIEKARTEGTIALSTQVLHEFYNISTRKLKPELPHAQAAQAVNSLCEFTVLGSSAASVRTALDLKVSHQISWWDALIVEAALRADASVLITEDGQHGREYGKLRLENPFV
jgi:predicted nucleic acid-binding protein